MILVEPGRTRGGQRRGVVGAERAATASLSVGLRRWPQTAPSNDCWHPWRREIGDGRVLDAIASTPREAFVTPDLVERAYDDTPLPIGEGQTISQPLMVALMLEALDVRPDDTVLDIGTGSGYQAALLSLLAARVVSVERIHPLAERARRVLQTEGYANVDVFDARDELGWPRGAPYDGAVVAAAAPSVPAALLGQLRVGGRLVIPVGTPAKQRLARVVHTGGVPQVRWLGACRFVPLIGEGGWQEDTARDWPRRAIRAVTGISR